MEKKVIEIFVDMTDYEYHLGEDYNGNKIFYSEESIKAHTPCVNKGCGIVKLKLDLSTAEVVQKEDWELKKSFSKTLGELKKDEYVSLTTEELPRLIARIRRLRKSMDRTVDK